MNVSPGFFYFGSFSFSIQQLFLRSLKDPVFHHRALLYTFRKKPFIIQRRYTSRKHAHTGDPSLYFWAELKNILSDTLIHVFSCFFLIHSFYLFFNRSKHTMFFTYTLYHSALFFILSSSHLTLSPTVARQQQYLGAFSCVRLCFCSPRVD